MRGVYLGDLTWPEAKAWFDAGRVVVVPIGAAAKEHGHHLPLKTDYMLAEALSRGVAEALPVVVAPIVSFGYYPAFRHYPGSQHLAPETFSALLKDILQGFITQGVTRIAVINTGVSTEPVVHVVVRELYEATTVRIHVADIRRLGKDGRTSARADLRRPRRRARDLDHHGDRPVGRSPRPGHRGLRQYARGTDHRLLFADHLRR